MPQEYAIGLAIAAGAILMGCTEPSGRYYEGTIKTLSFVKDVFAGTETAYLGVDNPDESCDATVIVSADTRIMFQGHPLGVATASDLRPGQVIRVDQQFAAADVCPRDITPTTVLIVR